MSGRCLRSQRNFATRIHGMSDQAGYFEKSSFFRIVLSSHTVSSVARLSWLRIAGAIASLRSFTGTKVSPCELRHRARTGSERFLDTACEQWHTACQKRSEFISARVGAGNSGVYAQACWASISPVSANTTALHLLEPISMASKLMMVFDSRLLYRQVFIRIAGTVTTRARQGMRCGLLNYRRHSQEFVRRDRKLPATGPGFNNIDLSLSDGNTRYATKCLRHLKQQNQKPNLSLGLGRKPAIRSLSEQRTLLDGFASRNRERSRAELQSSAKCFSSPWR